ncbi:MAG TPA: MFS transporter [Bryobacteraceae bacterium]|nr:MFS transporter [Bryobacteraceae bacterium]
MTEARGTIERWTPAGVMLLVSLISYIDRNTLALLAPTILRETHLSGEQYGLIISGFSIAYMVANPIWGRILDRAGLRRGMSVGVGCWTVASIAHAFASGFWSFGAARAALGFGEGATFPGGLRAVVQTLPPRQHSRGLAVAYSGGSLGALVTPLVVTPIFLWWGWRGAFWFTGLIGLAWLALWSVISRRPDIRKRYLTAGSASPAPSLRDTRLWAFMCAYALGALPLGFVLYSASLYLGSALGCSQKLIGELLWIPPLGWEVGYFVWGWICDREFRPGASRLPALRRLLTICAVLSLPFALVPRLRGVGLVMLAMFFAMFVAAGFVILSIAYATDVYSAEHAGVIAGAGAGSWSAVVAVMMPLFGRLFDLRHYAAAFPIAAAIPIAGYVGWLYFANRQERAA